MKNRIFRTLRVILGLSLIVLAISVYREPSVWVSGLLPWVRGIHFFGSIRYLVMAVAIVEALVGIALLVGYRLWIAGVLGMLVMLFVLLGRYFSAEAVGYALLFFGLCVIVQDTLPAHVREMLGFKKR